MRASGLLAVALALGVLAGAPPASARCRLKVQLAGGSSFTRQARCVDGDPACDSDSKLDTTCDFQASLCFSTDGVTFAKDIQKKIFDSTCATAFCHGTGAASGGLDLSDGAAYANLVGVLATNEAAKAANLQRVLPNDPADSFLLLKLEGTLAAGQGVPMPLVGGLLPASAIDTIRRWIAAGASETAPF